MDSKEQITLVRKFEGHKNRISDVAVSPNGRYIVSGTPAMDGENEHYPLRVWELSSGKELDGFDFVKEGAAGLAFSPSGQRLAVSVRDGSRNYEVILYDFESREPVHTLQGHTDFVYIAAFSPNGRFVFTAGRDATIRMWDAEAGKALHVIEAGTPIEALAISRDGRHLLFIGEKNQLVVWDIEKRQESRRIDLPGGGAHSLAIASDGQTVCGGIGRDGDVLVCDLGAGVVRRMWRAHGMFVAGVEFTPDGRHIITAGHDRTIKIWDAETLALVASHQADSYCTNFMDITPDGLHIVTGGGHSFDRAANKNVNDGNYSLRLWQLPESVWPKTSTGKDPDESTSEGESLTLARKLKGHKSGGGPNGLALSPNGKYLLSAGLRDRTAILWNTKTWQSVAVLSDHPDAVNVVAFSPDGKFGLTGDHSGIIHIWDLETVKKLREIKTSKADHYVTAIRFLPDGKRFVSASAEEGAISVWELETGKEVRRFELPGWVGDFILVPGGKFVIAGGNLPGIRLLERWLLNLETGEKESWPCSNSTCGTFSQDGSLLVTAQH